MPRMNLLGALYLAILQHLPGQPGFTVRYRYYKRRMKSLGNDVRIDVGVYIERPEYVSIGDHCAIDRGTLILSGPDQSKRETRSLTNHAYAGRRGEVSIGQDTHISSGCIISGRGGVSIGAGCGLSSNVTIHSLSHHYRSHAKRGNRRVFVTPLVAQEQQALIEGPVVIEDNVGLALNAAVLPGVHIGPESFVSINAVVHPGSRFPPNSIIGGDPARRVRERFAEGGDDSQP